MIALYAVVLSGLALAALALPWLRHANAYTPRRRPLIEDVSQGMSREIDGEYESGVMSKVEYEELKTSSVSSTSQAEPSRGDLAAGVEDEIERRVQALRERKPGDVKTKAPASNPSAGSVAKGSAATKCPKCGRAVKAGDRFCTACGARLSGGVR